MSLRRPSQVLFFARTVLWQTRAAQRHAQVALEALHVPPILSFSITNGCILRCRGYCAQAIRGQSAYALSMDWLSDILAQADELGISFMAARPLCAS